MKTWAKIGIMMIVTGFVAFLSGYIVIAAPDDVPAALLFPLALIAARTFEDAEGLAPMIGLIQILTYAFIVGMAWVREKIRRPAVILLAVHLATVLAAFGYNALQAHRHAPDKQTVKSRYIAWHSALHDQRYSDAYIFMSPDYRARNTFDEFSHSFGYFGDNFYHLSPGCYLRINSDRAQLYPFESRWGEFWSGPLYKWIKIDSNWFFSGEYDHYVD